ncbi:MAG: WYL domain-containing transcriptional regulator [Kofleriaceae bacterium]|nr:WYL domain-containing transcriptional regulator [Kofleriaceae bacterium]MBP9170324.1 WYL domain-containing transcriptional regulator [Kofleriaceae bacterium]MBP9860021.1 WYL domain-containing transcriptional regulator [Kofleriaceae bacterium]
MATDPQLVRAAALLHALTTTKRGVSLRLFAERRGFNLRALYRDVEALERAGFPVQHQHGWYSLPADWLPPASVGVTQQELAALFFARMVTPGLRGTPIGRSLDSLWVKLSTRGAQGRLVPETDVAHAARATPAIDYSVHAATIKKLEDAIAERRVVWIRYRTAAGVESTREIEPGYLHWDGGLEAMYVPSWCRDRKDLRMFAVHRILAIDPRDERCPARAAMAKRALERSFRVWYRDRVEHVVVRFQPVVAGEIRERTWHPSQRLVDDREGGVYLHLDIAAPEELERWLLGFGAAAQVIEPASLAERVRAAHAAALAAVPAPITATRRAPKRTRPRAASAV